MNDINIQKLNTREKELLISLRAMYDKIEPALLKFDKDIESIENDALDKWRIESESLKEKIINDVSISEEDIEIVYIEELEKLRDTINSEAEESLQKLLKELESKTNN